LKISFRKYFDLIKLHVVGVFISNQKYNMLIDTGSDLSYINQNVLDKLNLNPVSKTCFIDQSNIKRFIYSYSIDFKINNVEFNGIFGENICCDSFDTLYDKYNIRLDGIIGSKLMNEIGLKIDLKKLFIVI
jgi:hypothetical protein